MNTETKFDFNSFALLVDQQNGHFYVQVASSLTQQVERIPIKFLAPHNIDLSLYSSDHERLAYSQKSQQQQRSSSLFYNMFGWLLDFSPNQIITIFVTIAIILVTILFVLKVKSPTQQAAEQIALNASAAAAAVIAANSYRSPGSAAKEYSSFNPYRYFTSNPDVQTYESSPRTTLFNKSSNLNTSYLDRSPTNLSFRNQTYKIEPTDPRTSNYLSVSPRGNQSRLNTTDRDGIRLFSLNPGETSSYSEANPFSNFEFSHRHPNQQYDSSDNEETRQQERRVPPRNRYT